jgi:two-component system, LuxR family, response regulator FixJ
LSSDRLIGLNPLPAAADMNGHGKPFSVSLGASDAPGPLHVVFVEDDAAVLNALRFAFQAEGYCANVFRAAEDVLRASLPEGRVCFVLDEKLPGLGGLGLLEGLRTRGVAAPAILITTSPSRALRDRAAALNVEIVEKPLLGDALSRKVREALARAPG